MIDPDSLARLALFADLRGPQLEEVAAALEEQRHPRGARLIREGLSGSGFYVILEGDVSIRIRGADRARLAAGDFFGEMSILIGEPASADVVVVSDELRCAVLAEPELRPLLLRFPQIALRMLEVGARRLRTTNEWAA